jgi:DNA helicase IV
MTTTDHPPDTGGELARERSRLQHARTCLAAMRDRARELRADGGDRVSSEYLAMTLHRRVKSLAEDPETPLFFGRLDRAPEPPHPEETFYVGRRHVLDDVGDPVVIDWRADLARAFYRASPREPMGIRLRRRFGFSRGELTAYEDEHLLGTAHLDTSRILLDEIERPREGPMRDIVATIQPEQDEIVRADLDRTVCVQGAPGTGKTAVGLHRAAYLLYTHRERLSRAGVLVVGPNRAFLRYIGNVLPALGEYDAQHATVAELVGHIRIRGDDPDDVARLKGDLRLAEVLRRAVRAQISRPAEPLVVIVGSRRLRISAADLAEAVHRLLASELRYNAGRQALHRRYADLVARRLEEQGDAPSDRQVDAIARSKAVRDAVDATWPAVEPARLVFRLLSDAAFLAATAADLLDRDEQRLLLWASVPSRPSSARWTLADAVLVDEVRDLIERTPSVGHVILDEAQDLSPMQCRAVGRRCSTGSATVLGDVAQGTAPGATSDWTTTLTALGKADGTVHELTTGYRVPSEVLEFASRLLPTIAPTLQPPTSLRHQRGSLLVRRVGGLWPAVVEEIATALAGSGSIGLVVADPAVRTATRTLRRAEIDHAHVDEGLDAARVTLVPASAVKGLEFDTVVVAEPAQIADGPKPHQLLYVVLTRAVSRLVVVHSEPLPAPLTGAIPA